MPVPETLARFTPAPSSSSRQRPRGFGVGHVDRVGVQREASRAQASDRDEAPRRRRIFKQQILAFLGGHHLMLR